MRTRSIVTTTAAVLIVAGLANATPKTASLQPGLSLRFDPAPAPRNLYRSPFGDVTLRAKEAPPAAKTPPALELTLLPVATGDEPLPKTFVPAAPLDRSIPRTTEPIPFGEYRYEVGGVGFSLTLPTGRDDERTGFRRRVEGTPQRAGFGISVNLERCEPR